MNKRVLVIVVTYNGMRWLERCLGSLSAPGGQNMEPSVAKTAQNAPGGLNSVPPTAVVVDLYVFDNDSTDGSADYVAAHYPKAKLVRSAENLGFSRPNNLGMQYALDHGYDYVYLLNQDAWLEPGALEKLVAAAEAHPDFAVLSPLQMTDGYKALDRQFEKIFRRSAPQNDKECTPGTKTVPTVLEVRRIMAAHWLVPVWALRQVGVFNEELFPHWGQDDDWCNRARFQGLKVGVVPAARAVHDREYRKESKETLVKRNYYNGTLVRLANPNKPFWTQILFSICYTFVKIFKYRSFLPLKYLRTIYGKISTVNASRTRK